MRIKVLALTIGIALRTTSNAAVAASTDPVTLGGTDPAAGSTTLNSVEVNAALDKSRNQLSPDIGASQYMIEQQAIQQLPLGDATPLNQVLLQAPGVVRDSYGQLHVRGDLADLQHRLNGVIIPESISGFGQTLDTRLIDNLQLLTGALPAQYGYRTAGIVDITTKTGAQASGGSIGITAGSFDTVNPASPCSGTKINGPTSSAAVFWRATSASKIPRRRATRFTITPSRQKVSVICRACSTTMRG